MSHHHHFVPGQRIVFQPALYKRRGYFAKPGAEAVVGPRGVYTNAWGDTYVHVIWDRPATPRGQADGGYYPQDFDLKVEVEVEVGGSPLRPGDLIHDTDGRVDGVYLGAFGSEHIMAPINGEGWSFKPIPPTLFDHVDLSALREGARMTGWYFDPALAKRIEHVDAAPATPKEPSAPQTKALLALLKRKGSVTQIEAGGVLKVRSLTKRISELRALGWPIRSEWKRDDTDQRYVRYHLQAA